MPSVLFEYEPVIKASDGVVYRARACGSEFEDGTWQGWLEFLPRKGGKVLLSPRETIQSNRHDLVYWASGLTAVYLEGALSRALNRVPPSNLEPPAATESSGKTTETERTVGK